MLEITFVRMSVCVCVPQAVNYYSLEIKPEKLKKQIILLSGFYINHLPSILHIDVAIVKKCIVNNTITVEED